MSGGRLEHYFTGLLRARSLHPADREQRNHDAALQKLHLNFADDTNTVGGMRGTLWAGLNAATEYADHQRPFRGTGQTSRAENRLDSIWFGSANAFKQSAYRAAVELAPMN